MKEYTTTDAQESAHFDDEARKDLEASVTTRHLSEEYVRVTVFLATVLLFMAIGQRLRTLSVRKAVVIGACVLFVYSAYHLLTPPRSW